MHEESQAPTPWLRVARILRPHGVRGEVMAELLTDFPERFTPGAVLHLSKPGHEEPSRQTRVERARGHAGRLLLQLADCATRDAAEALRGWELVVAWSDRMTLGPDDSSIYLADLVGATLHDRTANAPAGAILGLDRESSAMDLLVVQTAAGAELLVPFALAYCPAWDPAARTLTMTLPDGLLTLDHP